MNKADLIAAVEKSTSAAVTPAVAAEAVDAVFSTIVRSVAKGESVTVIGFGVFEKRKRAARVARNPRTGAPVKVRATSVPAFRPSDTFKAATTKKVKLPKDGSVIRRGALSGTPAPVKVAAPVKKVAPAKVAAPAKKAAPVKKIAVTKAAPAPVKKAPAKKVSKVAVAPAAVTPTPPVKVAPSKNTKKASKKK